MHGGEKDAFKSIVEARCIEIWWTLTKSYLWREYALSEKIYSSISGQSRASKTLELDKAKKTAHGGPDTGAQRLADSSQLL